VGKSKKESEGRNSRDRENQGRTGNGTSVMREIKEERKEGTQGRKERRDPRREGR
jgi:hypothetical protein